jgi:DNA segregation ATPase FtsK/SpoIIIE, S-DNA-T family
MTKPGPQRRSQRRSGCRSGCPGRLVVFYLETDNDTGKRNGHDAAADIVTRIIAALDAGALGEAPGAVEDGIGDGDRACQGAVRDLLADLAAVLGEEKVPAARVPARLRTLAPDDVPYRSLTGVGLRKLLARHGVKVPSTGNRYPVDPATIRARLAERARSRPPGRMGE